MNISFESKVALVTGAGSGLGLATAKAFAESGASVVLADANEEAVGSAAEEMSALGHKALAIRCDVADDAEVESLVETKARTPRFVGQATIAGSSSRQIVVCEPFQRDLARDLASFEALQCLAALMRSKLRFPSELHAIRHRLGSAFVRPLQDQLAARIRQCLTVRSASACRAESWKPW